MEQPVTRKSSPLNTLERIIMVSEKEFLDKGFRGASLRAIVKKAGVTTGAFYGYFKSKEELFDALVKEHATHLLGFFSNILEEFKNMPLEQQLYSMAEVSSLELKKMFEYIWEHKTAFELIVKSSDETKYENFIQEISQKDIESTDDFYRILEMQGKSVERIDPLIEQIVINSTFASFFNLILRDIPKEEAKRGLLQMFKFYRGGWNSLMHFLD